MRRSAPWIAAAVLGTGWALAMTATGNSVPAPQRATPTSVATIDLGVLFSTDNGLDELRDLSAALIAKGDELAKEPNRIIEEMKRINENLDQLSRTPDEELNDRATLYVLNAQHKALVEAANQIMGMERGRINRQIYLKSLLAIEATALAEGIDLVLLDDQAIEVKEETSTRVDAAILARQILYAGEAIDISRRVVQRMNNDYAVGH